MKRKHQTKLILPMHKEIIPHLSASSQNVHYISYKTRAICKLCIVIVSHLSKTALEIFGIYFYFESPLTRLKRFISCYRKYLVFSFHCSTFKTKVFHFNGAHISILLCKQKHKTIIVIITCQLSCSAACISAIIA